MKDRPSPGPERDALPTDVAERLLARAAELDSAQRDSTQIARLREAAAEAGMLPSAFDAALAELRAEGQRRPAKSVARDRRQGRAVLIAIIVAFTAAITTGRAIHAHRAGVEQAFLLRCLSPGDAAALVRPIVDPGTTRLRISSRRAPHVLTVRTATKEQMDQVRAVLERQDGAACEVPAAGQPQK